MPRLSSASSATTSRSWRARAAVTFRDRRTRIAHIDTGCYPSHVTRPLRLRTDLERNFVEGDGNPGSAVDPDNDRSILDNSGHGTGTLSILAGGPFAPFNIVLGGAPDADVLPRTWRRVEAVRNDGNPVDAEATPSC